MDPRLRRIMDSVLYEEPPDSDDATEWLIYVLERKNTKAIIGGWDSAEDFYKANVPQELLELDMDNATQAEIVELLKARAMDRPDDVSLLFLFRKIRPHIALVPLIEVIVACQNSFDDWVTIQAHNALTALLGLPIDEEGKPTGEQLPDELIVSGNIQKLVEFVIKSLNSPNEKVREGADVSKRFLEAYGIAFPRKGL